MPENNTSSLAEKLREVGCSRPVSKSFDKWFREFQKMPEGKIDKSLSDKMAKSVNN